MKKVCIYILAALLLYSLFRELNLVKTLLICAGLAAAYGIYRLPSKYVMAMKYPFILLSFAATTGLFFYPTIKLQYPLDALVVFVSFYSITFFLIAMDEKKKDFAKETMALSILFLSLAFNVYVHARFENYPSLVFSTLIPVPIYFFFFGFSENFWSFLISSFLLTLGLTFFGRIIRTSYRGDEFVFQTVAMLVLLGSTISFGWRVGIQGIFEYSILLLLFSGMLFVSYLQIRK